MTSPDPIQILQRLSALSGAGRAVPADLAADALAWLSDAAPLILSGESPASALGLATPPGAWSRVPHRAAKYADRDGALAALVGLATGCQSDRANITLEWIDAHQAGQPVPAPALPHVEAALAAGLPIPTDARSVERIARARATPAHVVTVDGNSEILDSTPRVAVCGNQS
jgi:hypothetical protein